MSTQTTRLGAETGPRYFLSDRLSRGTTIQDSRRAFVSALPRTVELLEKAQPAAKITIIGQAPEPGFDVAQCMLRARMYHRSSNACDFASLQSLPRLVLSDRLIAQIAARDSKVRPIFLDRVLCSEGRCRTAANALPLYSDFDHLTPYAAKALLAGEWQ